MCEKCIPTFNHLTRKMNKKIYKSNYVTFQICQIGYKIAKHEVEI